MKTLLLVLLLAAPSFAMPVDISLMLTAVDNTIIDAAQTGHKEVFIPFGHADAGHIEIVAQNLRQRGYVLDEEAFMVNPHAIKVLYLKVSKK